MFAFSEGSWKGRVEFYLEKGISKLKEKDWTNIMKGAAEHSTFILKSTASSASALEPTEEELEMEWESDEDVDPATWLVDNLVCPFQQRGRQRLPDSTQYSYYATLFIHAHPHSVDSWYQYYIMY